MDGITKKKWFVYLTDHHEGPDTTQEISLRISQGQVTATTYVWADGMPDWQLITEIPELANLLKKLEPSPPPAPASVNPSHIVSSSNESKLQEASPLLSTTSMSPAAEKAFDQPILMEAIAIEPALVEPAPAEPAPAEPAPAEPAPAEPAPAEPAPAEPAPAEPALIEPAAIEPVTLEAAAPAEVEPQLETTLQPIVVTPELEVSSPVGPALVEASAEPSLEATVQPGPETTASEPDMTSTTLTSDVAAPSLPESEKPEKRRISFSPRILKFGIITGILLFIVLAVQLEWIDVRPLATLSRPMLLSLSEKLPFMRSWVSPLPPIDDVSPEEYEDLKSAARGKTDTSGPRISIALSKSDTQAPSFYVAGDLPDNTQFQVYVVGISDTLLNQISFGSQTELSLTHRLGKTNPIRFADGRPIPKGEYTVYVVPFEGQPAEAKPLLAAIPSVNVKLPSALPKDSKVLVYKTYFLGGTRDAIYATRLKEYHDKLRSKASSEINEIKQFTATLDSQLTSTVKKFATLRKAKISPSQHKAWEIFHNEWMKLQGQLDQIFLTWTTEALENQFFYGALYRLTQQAGNQVEKVHGFQNAFFSGVVDDSNLSTQLEEATASATSSIQSLRIKTEQAEKLGLSPNGMPLREGL